MKPGQLVMLKESVDGDSAGIYTDYVRKTYGWLFRITWSNIHDSHFVVESIATGERTTIRKIHVTAMQEQADDQTA